MSRSPYILFAGGYLGRIETLSFDPSSSPPQLQRISSTDQAGIAPTWCTLSSDGRYLYADDEWAESEGTLTSFKISSDGQLSKIGQSVGSGGLWPCHSTLLETTEPHRLFTSNYQGSTIASHVVLPSGELDASKESKLVVTLRAEEGQLGPHPTRQRQAHPHACTLDPTGQVLVVPDLGTDELRLWSVGVKRELTPSGTIKLNPGTGPRHVLFDLREDGSTLLYVMEELSNSISMFSMSYHPSSAPTFALLQSSVSLLPPAPSSRQSSFDHWHSAELAITPGSRFLIASNRAEDHSPLEGRKEGDADSFAIFPLSGRDGTLLEEQRRLVSSGGRAPRHFALSNQSMRRKDDAGEWLAVAHHDSDEVVIFQLGEGGNLTEVARLEGVGRPGCVMWA